MGGCQNYDPFLGTLNIRGRIIIGIQKGTIILTTTRMGLQCHLRPWQKAAEDDRCFVKGTVKSQVARV